MFCLILLRNNNFIHHIGACHEVKLDLVKDILPLLTVNELTMKYVLSIIPKAPNRLDLDTNWYFNLGTQFCKTVCIYIYFVIMQNSPLHIYLLHFSLVWRCKMVKTHRNKTGTRSSIMCCTRLTRYLPERDEFWWGCQPLWRWPAAWKERSFEYEIW